MFIGDFDVGAFIQELAGWGLIGLGLLFAFALLSTWSRASKEASAAKAAKTQALKVLQDDYFAQAECEGRALYNIKGFDEHVLSLDESRLIVAIDGREWPCSYIRGVEVISNGNRVASTVDVGNAAGAAAIGLIALGPIGALGGAAVSLSKHSEGTKIAIRLLFDDIQNPWIDFYTVHVEGFKASESYRAPLVASAKMHAERISILLQRSRAP
ncbi:hypothetical protein [Hyphomonas sp.]|uniref:hypothetical protein n=1 Tax=Hyphomonas sp. TaxID=87 RepID=UPI00391D9643